MIVVRFGDERLPDRFWDKVTPEPNTGCWMWTAALSGGYGHVSIDGAIRLAHVLTRSLLGPIEDGLEVDHKCRNRWCCNPEHLEPVTHAENMRRSPTVGRQVRPDVCPAGHPYDAANTIAANDRRRRCRTCHRDRARARRAA